MEVHEPYGSVPEPYYSSFIDRPLSPDVGRAWIRDTPLFFCRDCSPGGTTESGARCEAGRWRVDPERLREAEALYDAGLLYVDAQVARIYDALARRGLLDRTIVIVTSDHGETLGERGQMGHGWLYNSVLEIPLIVRYPRLFPPGRREGGTASLVDVLATVEDAAGLPASPTDGISLVPRQDLPARPVLAESAAFPEKAWRALGLRLRCDYSSKSRDTASLQSGTHKLIWSSAGDHELYDLGQDPREERDLHASRGTEVGKLAEALSGWRSALRKRRSGARGYEVDPATRKALESLGYVH
jgi:arylsulfatase A-like enzyme